MPSRKVTAAVEGKALYATRTSSAKTRVRESVVPKDPDVARLQEDVRQLGDGLLKNTPFGDGRIIEGTFPDANASDIEHGLGSPARFFFVVELTPLTFPPAAPPVVYRAESPTAGRADTHIRLAATEPCRVKLWVSR